MSTPRSKRIRDDRGAVYILAVFIVFVMVLSAGLVMDLGRQRTARRDAQALADVIALDMAREADGRALSQIRAQQGPDRLVEAALRNGLDGHIVQSTVGVYPLILRSDEDVQVTVEWGWFSANKEDRCTYVDASDDPIPAKAEPIPAGTGWFDLCNQGSDIPNAVMVTAIDEIEFMLLPAGGGPTSGGVSRSAVARNGQVDLASFRLGSSLAAINPQSNTIIGQLLNAVTDGDTTVLAYNGLVNANVGLDALGLALDIPITALSPQELADTTVSLQQLVVASAQVLQAGGGNTAAVTLLNDLVTLGISDVQVNLADVLGVDASNDTIPAVTGFVDVTNLLVAGVFLVDNDHLITIPGATVGIPGIADVQLRLTAIEAPRTVTGPDGAFGTTRQVDVEIIPTFDLDSSQISQRLCQLPSSEQNVVVQLLSGLLNFLGCVLAPFQTFPLGVNVTGQPTIALSLAEVTGTQSIDCANEEFTVTTDPSAVTLAADVDLAIAAFLGTPSDPSYTTQLARLHVPAGVASTGGGGSPTFTGVNPATLPTGVEYVEFTPPSAQIGANPIGLGNLLQIGSSTLTVLENIDLSVLANIVVGLAQPVLNDLLRELDTYIVSPLVQMLGLHVGGSHITPLWLRCGPLAVTLVG